MLSNVVDCFVVKGLKLVVVIELEFYIVKVCGVVDEVLILFDCFFDV